MPIGPTGTISTGLGDVSISANPLTQSVGANTNLVQNKDVGLNVGVGLGLNGPSVTPRVRFGNSQGAATGSSVGGGVGALAGTAVAGPLGGAVGSTVGSATGSIIGNAFAGSSQAQKEHKSRKAYVSQLSSAGLLDSNNQFVLPDGTTADFSADGHAGVHDWYDPTQKAQDINRPLFAYESDYTAPLDYISSMGGITLSRLLSGTKNKTVDQLGNLIGNKALGKVGYGAELSNDNFGSVMTNMRAMYARAGIQNKSDLLGLSNKMFSLGGINDADHVAMQQVGDLLFDNNFSLAQGLAGGKGRGLKVAGTSKAGGLPANKPGRIYSPIISPEEAMLSVQPYFDSIRQHTKGLKPSRLQNVVRNIQGGAQAVSAIGQLLTAGKNIADSPIGKGIGDLASSFGIGGGSDLPDLQPPDLQSADSFGNLDFTF